VVVAMGTVKGGTNVWIVFNKNIFKYLSNACKR